MRSSASVPSAPDDHRLQFYESDDFLIGTVAEFIAEGLREREPTLVIATDVHRAAFLTTMAARGVDVEQALASSRLVVIDATEALASFMVEGVPDRARFYTHIGGALSELMMDGARRVRAYGEMVDVLWREGAQTAALELEAMWNELQKEHSFTLLCAYSMGGFYCQPELLEHVSHVHGHVRYDPASASVVRSLVSEVAARRELEHALRRTVAELQTKEQDLVASRAELEEFLESAPFAMHAIGPDGTVLWANRAELALFGYEADEYVGRALTDLHADPGIAAAVLAHLRAGRALEDVQAAIRAKDGSIKHVRVSSNGRRDTHGRTRCITREIAERDDGRARGELLYGLARSMLTAETTGQVFEFGLDAMGKALGTTRGAILVLDAQQVMRFRAWRGLSDDYRAAVEGHSPWARDAREPPAIVVPDVERDAPSAPYLPVFARENIRGLAFIPLVGGGRLLGKFMAYYEHPRGLSRPELDLAQAIADHVAAALTRFHAIEDLRNAVRFYEMFTAVLGHDLRNPLAAISAATEVALFDASDSQTKALQRTLASAERMSRMIDQLLDFTRVRVGHGIPLAPSNVDLAAVVQHAIDELAQAHPTRAVALEQEGVTAGVWDADRLAQLFSNLVANAMKHGSVDRPVTVRIDGRASDVRVEVHNQGAIDSARLARLFEPLVDAESRKSSPGLGLGLFIAQEIARAHGGSIEARSSEAEGTTFTVVLPRDRIATPDVAEAPISLRRPRAVPRAEESEYRLLVDSIRDYAVFLLDSDGRVRTWNRGARLLKGYEAADVLGEKLEIFYTPEDRAAGRPRRLLAEAIEKGRVEDEGWRVRKDGVLFWADVIITALRGEDGTLRGFAKVTRDLTARRMAEEQLRLSEERFRLMVDGVSDYAIFMLDPAGLVATWNSGAERMKGYTANEILGQSFKRFYEESDVRTGRCEDVLRTAAREGRFEDEGWRVRKDGTRFWANVVITALHNASGGLLGYAKVTRDLTEQQRAEQQRARLAHAEQAVALRDEFLSVASHEIRTPLTALSLQLDALLEQDLDPATLERVERVKRSSDRLADLIESLLDVSRIAAGGLVLRREQFDLRQAIARVVASFHRTAERAHSTLTYEADEALVGSWDRIRVEQACASLLSNALKYGAGSPVRVRLRREGAAAVLEISDHGPGIAEEDLSRIFDRFERAASVRQFGGLGLGLYVARQVVDAHGGTVTASSAPDGGACFAIRLPLDQLDGEEP